MRRIIVTAGGTRERIDNVRSITNLSTGDLGSRIADRLLEKMDKPGDRLYYLHGRGAVLPKTRKDSLHPVPIEGTLELLSEMEKLLNSGTIDAVIHAMAVSDYRVAAVSSLDQMAEAIAQSDSRDKGHLEHLLMEARLSETGKISSELPHPVLILERNPKVISRIKELSPDTVLVGFKLLSGVAQEELLEVGYQLLQKNHCDFVLANDTDTAFHGKHTGYLIAADRSILPLEGKDRIAEGIVSAIWPRFLTRNNFVK